MVLFDFYGLTFAMLTLRVLGITVHSPRAQVDRVPVSPTGTLGRSLPSQRPKNPNTLSPVFLHGGNGNGLAGGWVRFLLISSLLVPFTNTQDFVSTAVLTYFYSLLNWTNGAVLTQLYTMPINSTSGTD